MALPILDLVVLGVILISGLLAAVRGFTREVLAIAAWVAAAAAALLLHPALLPYVKEHIPNQTVALVATIAAIFLITLIIVSFITVRLSDFVLDSRIGALDRSLGFFYGAARGVLICVVGLQLYNWLIKPEAQPDWARNAKTRPFLESTGEQLKAMLPADPEATLRSLRPPKPDTGTPPEEPAQPATGAPAPKG